MIPHGFGMFYGSRAMNNPSASAARTLSCAASHAFVLVESVDGRRQSIGRMRSACAELGLRDVAAILYIFPRSDRHVAAIEHLITVATAVGVRRVMLDLEPFEGHDWTQAQVDHAIALLEGAGLEVSISIFHRRQWLAIDWGAREIVLQLYQTAADANDVDEKVAYYARADRRVIPAVGTYLGAAARLVADLVNIESAALNARGFAAWVLESTDIDEAEAIRDAVLRSFGPPATPGG